MQESVLGMQPRALVGKWDTGFAVGVGLKSGSQLGSQELIELLAFLTLQLGTGTGDSCWAQQGS